MFQPQTLVYCVLPVTPSADTQRSSVDINNIQTQTSLLLMNTRPCGGTHNGFVWVSCYIYLTFGHWGVQAALDTSNIRPLKVNVSVLSDKGICTTHIVIHGGRTGACISMTLYVLFTPLLSVNFQFVTPFTCEYGTPLPTVIFEHVSSRPAFCKLIVL